MKIFKPSFLPGSVWLIISTILLVLPGSSFPKEDWLSKLWFDKWVHIGIFAIMVFLWCWAFQGRTGTDKATLKKRFLILGLVILMYGVSMEFVQKWFVPNRSFDPGDILADALGCAIGLAFSLGRYVKK